MSRLSDWWNGSPLEERSETPPPSDPSTTLVIPSRSDYERLIGTREAMGLGSVYRAVSIITTAVSQLTVDAYRGSDVINPAPLIVRSPSAAESASRTFSQTAHSLAVSGNFYWLIDFSSTGGALGVTVLNPFDVTITSTNWGTPTTYHYRNQDFTADRIRHGKLLPNPGSTKGLGPIEAAQLELSGAYQVAKFAGTWFDDSGTPAGGYITTPGPINPEQAKNTREAWTAATADRRGLPIIGNGFEYKSTLLSPKDALWIEAQQFSTTTIARIFGIPANLMLAAIEGGSDTYANLETEFTTFARFGLMPYIREIEEALSSLLPRGTVARFNLDGLLRSDTTTRYAAHAVAIDKGFLTVNEVRAIEGLPPLPESAPTATPEPEQEDAA